MGNPDLTVLSLVDPKKESPKETDQNQPVADAFSAWDKKLSSAEYVRACAARQYYPCWNAIRLDLEETHNIVKVGSLRDFVVILPDYDESLMKREREYLAKANVFVNFLVFTLQAKRFGCEEEYVIVGCTDERNGESINRQLYTGMLRTVNLSPLAAGYEPLIDDKLGLCYEDRKTGIRFTRDEITAKQKLSHTHRKICEIMDKNPENCFAICRFSKAEVFAEDAREVLEPSAILTPKKNGKMRKTVVKSNKTPRFKVTKAELNRLPRHNASPRITYALAAFYLAAFTLDILSGLWIMGVIFLPIWVSAIAINARKSNTQLQTAYLMSKHAVLPRKTWEEKDKS